MTFRPLNEVSYSSSTSLEHYGRQVQPLQDLCHCCFLHESLLTHILLCPYSSCLLSIVFSSLLNSYIVGLSYLTLSTCHVSYSMTFARGVSQI